ncbi:hypothetical protein [Paenibacillus sp. OSY-SE]|uniref:hypothetical protein n=1 Tax=Paenibacillus sp. OSY-SE TaxID=1196323 RepID=UPI00037B72DC|nr:hypothetical protein [Paenibacillus sp. OSY-SE]
MKYLSKALLCSIAAFGLLAGSVSAESLNQKPVPVTTDFTVLDTIVNPVIKLKVGWSTWIGMSGSKVVLVSGEGVVSLDQYGRVVALKPGNATVYNYASDGNLYINYIQVTY